MTLRRPIHPHRDHVFYTGMAAASTLIVFAGFSRTYFLKSVFGSPVLPALAHIHGTVFAIWTLFFLIQATSVAAGRTDVHRRLGRIGGLLAGLVVVLGTAMTITSVRAGHASGRPFMGLLLINSLVDLLLFTGFVSAGLYYRHNNAVHKRLMLLAILSVIIPAYARLPVSPMTIGWLIMISPVLAIAYDALFLRRMYAANVIGAVLVIGTTPLRFAVASTAWWQEIFEWVTR